MSRSMSDASLVASLCVVSSLGLAVVDAEDDSKKRVDADGSSDGGRTVSAFMLFALFDGDDDDDPNNLWLIIFLNLFNVDWLNEWSKAFLDDSSMLIRELRLLIEMKLGCGFDFFLQTK